MGYNFVQSSTPPFMSNLRTFLCGVLILGMLSLSACSKNEDLFLPNLLQAIELAQQNPPHIVHIGKVTDFSWDDLFIFWPYTPIDYIDESLGSSWKGARRTGIDRTEAFQLFVFVKDGEVVRGYRWPITNAVFFVRSDSNPHSFGQASFVIGVDEGLSVPRAIPIDW